MGARGVRLRWVKGGSTWGKGKRGGDGTFVVVFVPFFFFF